MGRSLLFDRADCGVDSVALSGDIRSFWAMGLAFCNSSVVGSLYRCWGVADGGRGVGGDRANRGICNDSLGCNIGGMAAMIIIIRAFSDGVYLGSIDS